MPEITVSYRGKPSSIAKGLPVTFQADEKNTIEQVKRVLAEKLPKFRMERQKLSLKSDKTNKALDDQATLSSLGLGLNEELIVKDLGPQISWRTVFLVEYAGPLLIHPIFYYFPTIFYGRDFEHSKLQSFVYFMIMAHFTKRELETLFVHRFSHGTMPFKNIFKNSAHYHIVSGLAIAWSVYSPSFGAQKLKNTLQDEDGFLQLAFAAWALAEFLNLHSHIILRNLRPPGTRVRAIPKGFGFDLVSCPNYFWETLGWAIMSIMTKSISVYVFTILSTAQMIIWALKKHRAYKREFGKEYPKNRKAMFPFLL